MTTNTIAIDHPSRRLVVALPRPYDAAREHYETLVPEVDSARFSQMASWQATLELAEINGSTLVGHYTSRYKNFGGLQVATRRRVFRRNPDNTVNLNLPSITLDVHEVELVSHDEKVKR